jgi:hypothetical protein
LSESNSFPWSGVTPVAAPLPEATPEQQIAALKDLLSFATRGSTPASIVRCEVSHGLDGVIRVSVAAPGANEGDMARIIIAEVAGIVEANEDDLLVLFEIVRDLALAEIAAGNTTGITAEDRIRALTIDHATREMNKRAAARQSEASAA